MIYFKNKKIRAPDEQVNENNNPSNKISKYSNNRRPPTYEESLQGNKEALSPKSSKRNDQNFNIVTETENLLDNSKKIQVHQQNITSLK